MHRLKIFVGSALLIITLFVLTLSAMESTPNYESKASVSNMTTAQNLISKKELQLYNLHQQELSDAIKAYFDKAIASGDIVGAGVSVVKGDSIVISDGFGKRNINFNDGVDGETIFRLGSLSKGFAGVLTANLKVEGKINWDDKVSDYIPEFQLGVGENATNITLANILSHTSGTPYHSYTNLVEAGLPLTDIAKRFKNIESISEPGLMYSYQNAMFALSGEIMYDVTGQEITTLLKNKFFDPLEMCNTSTDHETLMQSKNIAMPHSKYRSRTRALKLRSNYYNAVAAGGVNASAVDMAKWMRFLLGYNPEVMSRSGIAEAFNPFIEIKGHSKYYQRWPGHVASYYGYGWRIHKYLETDTKEEKTIWHHGGSVNNYRNEIAVYPEDDLGICVLLNSNSRLARNVIPDLHKLVKDVYKQPDSKIALNKSASSISSL